MKLLLGEGRWDGGEEGKGDFTAGAKLPPKTSRRSETVTMPAPDALIASAITCGEG